MQDINRLLPTIPNVNLCIQTLSTLDVLQDVPVGRLTRLTRQFLELIRKSILSGNDPGSLSLDEQGLLPRLVEYILAEHQPRFRRVVNATGVVIHTNLGRSILPKTALRSISTVGHRYSNLEFDLNTGKRGSRYGLVEDLLCELTGAEAALVVNNNAAAVLIVLETLAKGKDAIVSRGQLVEIGGSFRIPDVMARSGARLVEVGATNRTHLRDYREALTDETGVLLKVHCSNYRIIGFTSEVSNQELVQLGNEHGVAVVEDLGSGSFIDLSKFGLEKEPTVQEVVRSGVDIVTFSGDKLLGGPQAGIIAGKKSFIERIKNNPLNRALRIDKFTLAGLEAILRCYLDHKTVTETIPTLSMIAAPIETVAHRAENCYTRMQSLYGAKCSIELRNVFSRVGGGAMPEQNIPSKAVAITPHTIRMHMLEKRLREYTIPVIGRVEDNTLLLDMRTVADDEVELIVEAVATVLG